MANKKRKVNYGSKNRQSSERLQRLIVACIRQMPTGTATAREIADMLGISRTLVHYHRKKLTYQQRIASVEEKASHGMLRFRMWSAEALTAVGVRLEGLSNALAA